MSEINIPNIETDGGAIPNIQINGTGIKNIQINGIGNGYIQDTRVWLIRPPQAIPIAVPVTATIGTPIVNMPGCVKVSKENNYPSPNNRNKLLVDDDPKGNTVLCDAGAPFYEPANYDARELTWQTVYQNEPEVEGVDVGAPAPDLDTPEPPPTSRPKEEVECPPPNARRIGDLNTAGTEKVKEFKLTPDKLICETIWEPVPTVEQFVPSIPVVSTTATIAAVATTSALLAKPLADLLLKVVKPAVKKAIAKVQKILGKTPRKLTPQEKMTDRYREKKGMLPMKRK
tara:strand:+ start:450 stop:1307 length:858 start_codon:yes stop_codon:yes gene_type:complete